jgi:hypothetical protein
MPESGTTRLSYEVFVSEPIPTTGTVPTGRLIDKATAWKVDVIFREGARSAAKRCPSCPATEPLRLAPGLAQHGLTDLPARRHR